MELQLVRRVAETADIYSFVFAPIQPFAWQAGQSVRLEIAGPYGPIEHRFSISSPPSSEVITITTRLSQSAYKKSLFAMRPGDTAKIYGLEGDFTWRESPTPHLFIAAGVGVTPFHAMLAERIAQKLPLNATLIYIGRTMNLAFRDEISGWALDHQGFAVEYLIGGLALEHIKPSPNQLIYISGPSKMVDTVRADLLARGFLESHIIRDIFTGQLPELG